MLEEINKTAARFSRPEWLSCFPESKPHEKSGGEKEAKLQEIVDRERYRISQDDFPGPILLHQAQKTISPGRKDRIVSCNRLPAFVPEDVLRERR